MTSAQNWAKQLYPRDKATFKKRERLQPGHNQQTQKYCCFAWRYDSDWRNEFARFPSGVGGTPYYGLYGEAPPWGCTFFRLQVYERVGISRGRFGGGARGALAPPPPDFWTKLRPEGPKKFWGETAPLLFSRSGSGTDFTSWSIRR